MKFCTDITYADRESKALYVWSKYRSILKGRILDVGADAGHLKAHLRDEDEYTGIDVEGHAGKAVDLERESIPFPDASFDCVLCLDVLEHLDNLHEIFDELCRVSRRYVITSLPNPWRDFMLALESREYEPGRPMKFYGLPFETPVDRHKWFFSSEEAKRFIRHRSRQNRFVVVQMDCASRLPERRTLRSRLRTALYSLLFRDDLNLKALSEGTLWAVLERADER